jgi:hypothetical protein
VGAAAAGGGGGGGGGGSLDDGGDLDMEWVMWRMREKQAVRTR